MGKRDHEPYTITAHRGLYSRNDDPAPPAGFMNRATNLVFDQPSIEYGDLLINTSKARVREQFTAIGNLPANSVRFYIYKKSTGDRLIILDSTGNIWDATSNEIICSVPTAIDFHGITLNDRFYFTPHNLVTGINGEFLYIYDPTFPLVSGFRARKAAGAPATGTFTVAVSAVNGSIEPGIHMIAISFKTNTGFITKPALHTSFTAPSGTKKKLSLTAIPIGPDYVTSRIIWMSKVQLNSDGNLKAAELFNAYEIENNTTTSLADIIDKYDTDLQQSADPYTDLLPEIPAGTYLSLVGGRLVNCGAYLDPDTLRISNPSEPEAIDSVDGIRQIEKGLGGGIKTTRPMRGNIAWWKSYMTGVLRPNDDDPVNWPYDVIDSALGSEPYGVSESIEYPGLVFDNYLVANKAGLHLFNGGYADPLTPLSYNISPSWEAAGSLTAIKAIKIVVDPLAYRIYALVPGSGGVMNWFMGDFSDGLSADAIKWSPWKFDYLGGIHVDYVDAHVVIDPVVNDAGTTLLAIARNSDALRRLVTGTFTDGLDVEGNIAAVFGWRFVDKEFRDIHLNSIKFLASASVGNKQGAYDIKATGTEPILFQPSEFDSVIEKFPNTTDRIIEINITAINGDLNIADVLLFMAPVYQERPNDSL